MHTIINGICSKTSLCLMDRLSSSVSLPTSVSAPKNINVCINKQFYHYPANLGVRQRVCNNITDNQLPCSSNVAHTRMSTHTALVCTLSLNLLIVGYPMAFSFSSFSTASCSRDCSSLWPFRNICLVKSWISFTKDAGKSILHWNKYQNTVHK